ncbi:MAG TPA: YicC/YloC family endoribonuclease [Acidobacteriota bacterium]|nr:YicC/YloC family endoribonuclease [Acidobacteriota bacterium]
MILGMTGFAERSFSSPTLRLKLSVKTLNHRFFDWSYKGAPIGEAESRLRAMCQKRIRRGRVEIYLDLVSLSPESWDLSVNEGLLEKILATLDRISRRTGRKLEISLDSLLRVPQLFEVGRRALGPDETAFLERSFDRTLDDVMALRRHEGRETARQLRVHLTAVRRAVGRAEAQFKRQPTLVKAKLKKRLTELNGGAPVPEARLAEEAAFLTQRYDLAEEIGRLKTHLDSFEGFLSPKLGEPVGRQLDFLAQELNREANTLASKSQDVHITRESLAIKNALESMRQHVQNVE